MGIYDSVVFHDSVSISEYPLDISFKPFTQRDGRRVWQTKDLNPSLDMYGILPEQKEFDGGVEFIPDSTCRLCRRHPPLTEWTTENKGRLAEGHIEDIVADAHHWRQVRFSGEILISELAEDAKKYVLAIEFTNGFVDTIRVISEPTPVNLSHPREEFECIDTTGGTATYNGTAVREISQRFYGGEDIDVQQDDIISILKYYNSNIAAKIW